MLDIVIEKSIKINYGCFELSHTFSLAKYKRTFCVYCLSDSNKPHTKYRKWLKCYSILYLIISFEWFMHSWLVNIMKMTRFLPCASNFSFWFHAKTRCDFHIIRNNGHTSCTQFNVTETNKYKMLVLALRLTNFTFYFCFPFAICTRSMFDLVPWWYNIFCMYSEYLAWMYDSSVLLLKIVIQEEFQSSWFRNESLKLNFSKRHIVFKRLIKVEFKEMHAQKSRQSIYVVRLDQEKFS